MTKILKGKDVVDKLNGELLRRTDFLRQNGIIPTLALLRVGNRQDDLAYERGAEKRAEKTGISTMKVVLPENITTEELVCEIEKLNEDEYVHGILIFRPLPKHLDDEAVRDALNPEKDVDGITYISQAGVFTGTDIGYAPCTAEACIELLDFFDIDLQGKKITVVGRSDVIGKPVSMMMLKKNATVTICHTKTVELDRICRESDIIVTAAGCPGILSKNCFSENQVVVDVAINFTPDNVMTGDVNFEDVRGVVGAVTPVPGGIGIVTTSILMKHCVEAAEKISREALKQQ